MRIGFDAKRAFFNRSGLGNYSRSTMELLSKHYPDNEYFLYSPKPDNPLNFKLKANMKHAVPESGMAKALPSVWRSMLLGRRLKQDGLDIYHGLSNELPADIRKSKVRSIATIHDLIFMRYPSLYKKTDRWIYQQKFRRSAQDADLVIAISEQTKRDIVDYLQIDPQKIEVVYQGCDASFYEQQSRAQREAIRQKYQLPEQFLLYVGTLEERKNALQIVKALYEQQIDMPLVLVGRETEYTKQIKDYLHAKQMEAQVLFFHGLPFADLPLLYQMASIFIYPSIFEGFGIPILEALHSQTPVITSTGSCFAETGGEHTLYVSPQSSEELGHAILQVLNDSQLANTMRQHGLAYAQGFRDEAVAKNLFDVYSKLMK